MDWPRLARSNRSGLGGANRTPVALLESTVLVPGYVGKPAAATRPRRQGSFANRCAPTTLKPLPFLRCAGSSKPPDIGHGLLPAVIELGFTAAVLFFSQV